MKRWVGIRKHASSMHLNCSHHLVVFCSQKRAKRSQFGFKHHLKRVKQCSSCYSTMEHRLITQNLGYSRKNWLSLNRNMIVIFLDSILIWHFRYRLVRHTWNLNVNESLNVDATCTLNNPPSDDLGVDVYIKNQNQVHHALVTEIFLSDLKLFCPTFKFRADSVKCKSYSQLNRYFNNLICEIIVFRLTKSRLQSYHQWE